MSFKNKDIDMMIEDEDGNMYYEKSLFYYMKFSRDQLMITNEKLLIRINELEEILEQGEE